MVRHPAAKADVCKQTRSQFVQASFVLLNMIASSRLVSSRGRLWEAAPLFAGKATGVWGEGVAARSAPEQYGRAKQTQLAFGLCKCASRHFSVYLTSNLALREHRSAQNRVARETHRPLGVRAM